MDTMTEISNFDNKIYMAMDIHSSTVIPEDLLKGFGPFDIDGLKPGVDLDKEPIGSRFAPEKDDGLTVYVARVYRRDLFRGNQRNLFPCEFDPEVAPAYSNFTVSSKDTQRWIDVHDQYDTDEDVEGEGEDDVMRVVVRRYRVGEMDSRLQTDMGRSLKSYQMLRVSHPDVSISRMHGYVGQDDVFYTCVEYTPSWSLHHLMHEDHFRHSQNDYMWLHANQFVSTMHSVMNCIEFDYMAEIRYVQEKVISCIPMRHYNGYVELKFMLHDLVCCSMPDDIRDVEPMHVKQIVESTPPCFFYTVGWSLYRIALEMLTGMKPFDDFPPENYLQSVAKMFTRCLAAKTMMRIKPIRYIPHTPEYLAFHCLTQDVFLSYFSEDHYYTEIFDTNNVYKNIVKDTDKLSMFPTLARNGWEY